MSSSDVTTQSRAARTYGGWQAEKVAFIFGLSARRAAILGAAVLAAIMPIATTRISSAVILWPAAAVLALVAMVRIQGRTGDEWAASAVSYALIAVRDQHLFAGGPYTAAPVMWPASGDGASDDGDGPLMELPGILAPLRLLSVPAAGRDLAVVHHPHDRTYTAVARVRFPGIGLADSARRDQRVAGWGALLAGLCAEGSPIVRVQALQRLIPESGVALRAWHEQHLADNAPELATSVAEDLLASSRLSTSRREPYLSVVMDARRAAGPIRAAGGGDVGAAAVLIRHLRALSQSLGTAELEVEDWLGARDLAEVIRTAYDPASVFPLAARRALAASAAMAGTPGATLAPGAALRQSGPVHAEARPGRYVHDGAVSVSYWVHGWPRSQAWSTALGPLLGDAGSRRSFGMIFEPLSPRVAERAVMRERTARHVAVRMRQRTEQIVPEHERAAMALAEGQDAERAAGHGLVRFTATPPSPCRTATPSRTRAPPWRRTRRRRGSSCAGCGSPRTQGSPSARCRWAWACPAGGGSRCAGQFRWPRSASPPTSAAPPSPPPLPLLLNAPVVPACSPPYRRAGGWRGRGAAGRRSCRRSRCSAGARGRCKGCTRGCTAGRCRRPGRCWAWTA